MATNISEDLIPSTFFSRILLQSGQYSSSNPLQRQPTLETGAEKLLVKFATLFAQELVSKSSTIAQQRTRSSSFSTTTTTSSSSSSTAIHINDVNFVLKHQWPLYDSSSYNKISEN